MPYAECVQIFHYYQWRDKHMLFYAVEGLSLSKLVLYKPLIRMGLLDFWHFTNINWKKNKHFKTLKLKSN